MSDVELVLGFGWVVSGLLVLELLSRASTIRTLKKAALDVQEIYERFLRIVEEDETWVWLAKDYDRQQAQKKADDLLHLVHAREEPHYESPFDKVRREKRGK